MRSLGAGAALVLAACGGAGTSPGVVVRDSAGIEIVENGPESLAAAARWSLAAEPSLELRSRAADDVVLFLIADVAPLDDGSVAVANGGSQEVLVFDRSGSLLRRLGGEGEGPGEFGSLSSVLALEDSLGVYDSRQRRLSVFGPEGRLVREVALGARAQPGSSMALHPLSTGDFALFVRGGLRAEPGVFRPEAESFRISPAGEVLATYGSFPGSELAVIPGAAGAVLFGALTVAATVGEHLVVGLGERPELRAYAPSGSLSRILRWPDADRTVPAERAERFLEAGLEEMPEAQRPQMRAMFERLPKADRLPPYEDLIGSDAGDLWVGGYVGPERAMPDFRDPVRPWLVFDPAGALQASLQSPEGFRPLAVHGDELVGVFTDALGVESVRAYAILRGGAM